MLDLQCAVSSALAAARSAIGAARGSALVSAITENRATDPAYNTPHKYQWCGDFPTWAYEQAGVMDGLALNRVHQRGRWVIGDNLASLFRVSDAAGRPRVTRPEPGDIVVMNRPGGGHVALCSDSSSETVFTTIDGNSWYDSVRVNNRHEALLLVFKPSLFVCGRLYSKTIAKAHKLTRHHRYPYEVADVIF